MRPVTVDQKKDASRVVPFFQAREDAFFADARMGLAMTCRVTADCIWSIPRVYNLGRDDKDSDWRDGAQPQRYGKIRATVNTALAQNWQFASLVQRWGGQPLPLSDDQGVNYQASVTLLPLQSDTDTVAFQTAALFGDARYMNTVWRQRCAEQP